MGKRRERWLASLEPLSIFALIFLYIWRLRFVWPHSWIGILALVIVSHVVWGETPNMLGFGATGLWRPFAVFAPTVGLLSLALLGFGLALHTIRPVPWGDAFFSLAIYFVWGLFQQYLLNAYFLTRFCKMLPHSGSRSRSAVAAFLFAVVHLPNWFLMGVTLFGGYACAQAYTKYRSLYFLGFAHGLIGFLIYFVLPDILTHHLYVGPKWFTAVH